MNLEKLILSNLIFNEEFTRKVLPYIKEDYFHNKEEQTIFKIVDGYINKYNHLPAKEAVYIDLSKSDNLNEQQYKDCQGVVNDLDKTDVKTTWLIEQTEKWCQDKAIHNAILSSIKLLDDKQSTSSRGSIPKMLQDALSVSFDDYIGHDYFDQWQERWDFYHLKEHKLPFDLEYFNKITRGGISKKTLTIILAGTGVGKTLFMCHCAAANLLDGKNVLYITLEMAEERISERIDANLLDIPIDQLTEIGKILFQNKLQKLQEKTKGKLIVKEYPTSTANANNFRYLLRELALKKNFIPDVIYIDYLNICSSSRIKMNANANSYTYIKSIAEEIRGLAVEFDVPIISATQTNRQGYNNSDIGLEHTSESFGLPATADMMFGLVTTEELQSLGQVLVIQMKNRYSDVNMNKRFVVGIDKTKMRFYDVEESAQQNLVKDDPVMDNTDIEIKHKERRKKFLDGLDEIK